MPLFDWVFQDSLWLPRGLKFADLKPDPGMRHAEAHEMLWWPVVAAVFFVMRILYRRFIGLPLAIKMKVPGKQTPPQPNQHLEKYFVTVSKSPNQVGTKELQGQLGWSERKLQRWFRRRRNFDRPSKREKFVESSWRFLFYATASTYGAWTISKAPSVFKNEEFWTQFPSSFWPEVYYYYVIEASFYISLLCTMSTDVKRKDFTEQLIHHVATLFLISFSFAMHNCRIGVLVMILHDASDILLEFAKSFSYAGYDKVADFTFTLFAIVFILSRDVFFPFWVIRMTIFEFCLPSDRPFSCYFFNGFLLVLQALHLFWTSIILRMLWRQIFQGIINTDDRSDIEEQTSDEDEKKKRS